MKNTVRLAVLASLMSTVTSISYADSALTSAENNAEAKVMSSVPPKPAEQVTFHNYRSPPYSQWAFHNTNAFFNTLSIPRSGEIVSFNDKLKSKNAEKIKAMALPTSSGKNEPLQTLLENNSADSFLVVQGNDILFEQYFNGVSKDDLHIWFSCTKSIVSAAAGILVEQGTLDLTASPADYIPELKGSGFERVTVQHVLDHSTAIDFKENYTDDQSDFAKFYGPALGLMYLPGAQDVQPGTTKVYGVHDFVSKFVKPNVAETPGDQFDYNSTNADVLGWLVARISGMPLHRFIQKNIWSKLGTEHDALMAADRAFMGVATGGLNTSLRDAARFGQMILNRGKFNGQQIVPAAWVDATLNISAKDKQNMSDNPKYGSAPWQAYKNMWWVLDAEQGEYAAVGVYGQLIYINRSSNTVIAWHSSQAVASAANSPEFQRKLVATRAIAKLVK